MHVIKSIFGDKQASKPLKKPHISGTPFPPPPPPPHHIDLPMEFGLISLLVCMRFLLFSYHHQNMFLTFILFLYMFDF